MIRNINEALKFKKIDAFLYKIDPRSKLFVILLYLILGIIYQSLPELTILLIIVFIHLALGKCIRRYVITLLGLFPFLIIVYVINYLTYYSLINAFIPIYRFIIFIAILDIFFLTTDPDDFSLTLSEMHLPLNISLSFSLALRFIPSMINQMNEIIDAQLSRGLQLDRGNIITRIKNYLPILIPLIILSIKKSIEVAESLEIRGVAPGVQRIPYKRLKIKSIDYIYLIVNIISFLLLLFIGKYINLV